MYQLTLQDDEGLTRSIMLRPEAVTPDRVRSGGFARSVLLPSPPVIPGPVHVPHPMPPPTRLIPLAQPVVEITAETLRPVHAGLF
jgi:hypothetical protein